MKTQLLTRFCIVTMTLSAGGAMAATLPSTSLTPDVWWKADATDNTVSSGTVTGLTDQSGNGNNASIGVNTAPALISNDINGQPALRFNGSSDALTSPTGAITGNTSHTIFIVAANTGAGGFRNGAAFYSGTAGGAQNSSIGAVPTTPNNPFWVGGFGQDGAPYTGSNLGSGFHILDKTYTASTSNYLGVLDGTVDVNATGNTYSLGSADTGIGKQFDGGSFYQGDIAEVIMFSSALSTSDRASVESYLSGKYGIAVPEPTSLSLLGLGGIALLARRRKD